MPHRFTKGDIKSIALRLGLQQINSKKWSGTDIKGHFLQTYIHEHGDGFQVLVGTARQHAIQMGFQNIGDMYDFMKNKKRRR